jgi:dTDP-4-dehydrorhamnose 3,5-epimerase-like enzyme
MDRCNGIITYFSMPHTDERGTLINIIENLPLDNFEIKNIFSVKTQQSNIIRGNHAHYRVTQIMFNLVGTLAIEYYNNQGNDNIILHENEGVIIPPLTWVIIKTESDYSIYIVFSNGKYEESEYIRDIDKFYELIKNGD